MALKQVLDVYEILDDIHVNGEVVTEYAKSKGILDATYTRVDEGKGPTDFIRLVIPGRNGKLNGGKARHLALSASSAESAQDQRESDLYLTVTVHFLPLQLPLS